MPGYAFNIRLPESHYNELVRLVAKKEYKTVSESFRETSKIGMKELEKNEDVKIDLNEIPKIEDPVEQKILPYLQKRKDNQLEVLKDSFYRLHIYCKYLLYTKDKENIPGYKNCWQVVEPGI